MVDVMERREDLDPAMRRRFRTGKMCIDFTHTGGDGEAAPWEILRTPADVARFLAIIIGAEPPSVSENDMDEVREVRRAISALARATAAGEQPPAHALTVINAAAAEPSLVPRLDARRCRHVSGGTAGQALSTLARDAIDLFSSPLSDRIRVCQADDCGLLFVDSSRPGTRRWCSMEWCGDRAKKRAAGRPVRGRDMP